MRGLRATYLGLFLCNAIFAAVFRSAGEGVLARFGTFKDCDESKNPSCKGNQMIFRASFSIAVFFLLRTCVNRFWRPKSACVVTMIVCIVEVPIYVGILVGSFYIPSEFFEGYFEFARVASGFFILFQILSIVDFSYQMRDTLIQRIELAEQSAQGGEANASSSCVAVLWKSLFLGLCVGMLCGIVAGLVFLYQFYGNCGVGMAFTTVTTVFAVIFVAICVSPWFDAGLLPPCVVSGYLVLMCWQALTSNPDESCEPIGAIPTDTNRHSVIYSAIVGAFAMTWTSWRTSSAATDMFAHDSPSKTATTTKDPAAVQDFSTVVVVDDVEAQKAQASAQREATTDSNLVPVEPWQFHFMMFLGGVYMAMVLTDWNSTNSTSNGVSMWVKIVSQWLTILLFLWTSVAPKLFPNRDFR